MLAEVLPLLLAIAVGGTQGHSLPWAWSFQQHHQQQGRHPNPQPRMIRDFQPSHQLLEAPTTTETPVTTTAATNTTKKGLVTLPPVGNSIQDILFNAGYRKEEVPDPNDVPADIDDIQNIENLHPSEVFISDGPLLVLRGGSFPPGYEFSDPGTPIDDYEAPYREPILPPPGFDPNIELNDPEDLANRPPSVVPLNGNDLNPYNPDITSNGLPTYDLPNPENNYQPVYPTENNSLLYDPFVEYHQSYEEPYYVDYGVIQFPDYGFDVNYNNQLHESYNLQSQQPGNYIDQQQLKRPQYDANSYSTYGSKNNRPSSIGDQTSYNQNLLPADTYTPHRNIQQYSQQQQQPVQNHLYQYSKQQPVQNLQLVHNPVPKQQVIYGFSPFNTQQRQQQPIHSHSPQAAVLTHSYSNHPPQQNSIVIPPSSELTPPSLHGHAPLQQRPISLESDIAVNYRSPLPPLNPLSETFDAQQQGPTNAEPPLQSHPQDTTAYVVRPSPVRTAPYRGYMTFSSRDGTGYSYSL